MTHTIVTIHHYEDGTLDCWVQEPGKPVVSFDPLQLPAKMKKAMGDALPAALAAKEAAEAEVVAVRADLEAKVEVVKALEADLAATAPIEVDSV